MTQALAVASEIQQYLLPQSPPTLEGFDIAGTSIPCDETGGDFFDYIEFQDLDTSRLGIAVGDVTGHGVGAGLLMASARSALRNLTVVHGEQLGTLFTRLNSSLHRDTGSTRFVTLFYGILNATDRTLHWMSAGHDAPLRLRVESGEFEELDVDGGFPLGMFPDASYGHGAPVTLDHGDIVLVGTDGIWEATNGAEEQFGRQRLEGVLRAQASRNAKQICEALVAAVAEFRGLAPQDDDMTLVVLKCARPKPRPR